MNRVVRTLRNACLNRCIYFDELAPRKAFLNFKNRHFTGFSFKRPSCDHHCVSNSEGIMPSTNTTVKYDRRYYYAKVCGGVNEFSI